MNYFLSVTIIIFIIIQSTTGTPKFKRIYDQIKTYKIEFESKYRTIYSDDLNYRYVKEYIRIDKIYLMCNINGKEVVPCPVRAVLNKNSENNLFKVSGEHNHEAPRDDENIRIYKIEKIEKLESGFRANTEMYSDNLNYKYYEEYRENGQIYLMCNMTRKKAVSCPVRAIISENLENNIIIKMSDEHIHEAPPKYQIKTYKIEFESKYRTIYSDDLNYRYVKEYIRIDKIYLMCNINGKEAEPCPVKAVISKNLENNLMQISGEHNHEAPRDDENIRTYKIEKIEKLEFGFRANTEMYSDNLKYKYYEEYRENGQIYLMCNMTRKKAVSCPVRAIISENLENNIIIKMSDEHIHKAPPDVELKTYNIKSNYRSNSEIFWDDLNFKYYKVNIENGIIYLICTMKRNIDIDCPVTATIVENSEEKIIKISNKHNHEADDSDQEEYEHEEQRTYTMVFGRFNHLIYEDNLHYKYHILRERKKDLYLVCANNKKKNCPVSARIMKKSKNNTIIILNVHNHKAPPPFPNTNVQDEIRTYNIIQGNTKNSKIFVDDLGYRYYKHSIYEGKIHLLCVKNKRGTCSSSANISTNLKDNTITILHEHNHEAPSEEGKIRTYTQLSVGKYLDNFNYTYQKYKRRKDNIYIKCANFNNGDVPSENCKGKAVLNVNSGDYKMKITKGHNHRPPVDTDRNTLLDENYQIIYGDTIGETEVPNNQESQNIIYAEDISMEGIWDDIERANNPLDLSGSQNVIYAEDISMDGIWENIETANYSLDSPTSICHFSDIALTSEEYCKTLGNEVAYYSYINSQKVDNIVTESGLNEGNHDVSKNDHLNSSNVDITENMTETEKDNSISEFDQLNPHKVDERGCGTNTEKD